MLIFDIHAIDIRDMPATLNNIAPRQKNAYGQYFTPQVVAQLMVGLSSAGSDAKALEPSCGEGVFLEALEARGIRQTDAYEIDEGLSRSWPNVRYESFISANVESGYDLVIGNPPYIRWKNLEPELKAELETDPLWNRYFNSLCDYLCIFILKGAQCLKPGGELIYICPEYWLNTTHAQQLRDYLAAEGYFDTIIHFNELKIFPRASFSPIIFKYVKAKHTRKTTSIFKLKSSAQAEGFRANDLKRESLYSEAFEQFETAPLAPGGRISLIAPRIAREISRLENACQIQNARAATLFGEPAAKPGLSTVGEVCEIANGMVSGLDKAFQIAPDTTLNQDEIQHTIPVVKAKHTAPYKPEGSLRYIMIRETIAEGELRKRFPAFNQQLAPFADQLLKRYDYGKNLNYWEWAFPRSLALFDAERPRILVPSKDRITRRKYFRFCYAETGTYPTQDVSALFLKEGTRESIFYVLAYLNHPAVFEWTTNKGVVKGGVVEFSERPLTMIPFRRIDFAIPRERELHDAISAAARALVSKDDPAALAEIAAGFDELLG